MRLLYVIDSLAPGGAETSLAAMAPALVEHGIDLRVFALGQALDLAPALAAAGAHVYRRTGKVGRLANVRAVRSVAQRIQPDLIHTTLFEADISGRPAALSLGIPATTSWVSESYGSAHRREGNAYKLRAARELDRLTAKSARGFHAVSHAVAEVVGPVLGIRPSKIEVIPRGRDPRSFPFQPAGTRAQVRRELSIPENSPVILAVGRLEPSKGLHHLMAALHGVSSSLPDAVVLVAGKHGRASDSLRKAGTSLPIRVSFLGHRTDIARLMAAADVLAFPSEREGSPGTLIEALAVGIPIVASRIGPNLEVLGEADEIAHTVPLGAVEPLARALVGVLENPAAARARAALGRGRFDDHYSIGAVAAHMASFFERAAWDT